MQRNRRIGTSLTGIASFADQKGLPTVREWMDEGYTTIRKYDHSYSEWLCVRESIRVTTVKPSGSVSILSGATPGVHWGPGGNFFLRAVYHFFRWAIPFILSNHILRLLKKNMSHILVN